MNLLLFMASYYHLNMQKEITHLTLKVGRFTLNNLYYI